MAFSVRLEITINNKERNSTKVFEPKWWDKNQLLSKHSFREERDATVYSDFVLETDINTLRKIYIDQLNNSKQPLYMSPDWIKLIRRDKKRIEKLLSDENGFVKAKIVIFEWESGY